MKLLAIFAVFVCLGCQSKYKQYEILNGEQFEIETLNYRNEPYYWELINPRSKPLAELESRVYSEKFLLKKLSTCSIETWTFRGIKTGTDTLKLHLKAYEEDTLNTPIADSLIIVVKVK